MVAGAACLEKKDIVLLDALPKPKAKQRKCRDERNSFIIFKCIGNLTIFQYTGYSISLFHKEVFCYKVTTQMGKKMLRSDPSCVSIHSSPKVTKPQGTEPVKIKMVSRTNSTLQHKK